MDEGGRHQSRGLDPTLAVVSAASHGGVALEVGQPFGDRSVVGCPHGSRGLESLSPHSTETDLGDEKVRSNPDTRDEPPRRAASGEPSCGETPARIARRSSGATSPRSPRASVPRPIHFPGASPVPV